MNGPLGTTKVATFPKGANVSIFLPSEVSGKAGLATVTDGSAEPQTIGLKLVSANACFARNDYILTQVNGDINDNASLGGPMAFPLAANGSIVFPQGGWGNGSDSALILPCNFDKLPQDIFGVIDAKFLKIETFYVYNVTATDISSLVGAIVQVVKNKHGDQFDKYAEFGAVKDSTNKYLAVVYTYLKADGTTPAENPPGYSVINFVGLPDSNIKSGNTSGLWVDGGVPVEMLEWTSEGNNKTRSVGISIGCLNPPMGGIQDIITGVKQLDQLPASFSLDQNYPNPFNPATVIPFKVSKEGRIRLAVYDLLGKEVAVLWDGRAGVGSHTIRWDASGLPSGVYFYRLEADGFSDAKKMMLLK